MVCLIDTSNIFFIRLKIEDWRIEKWELRVEGEGRRAVYPLSQRGTAT